MIQHRKRAIPAVLGFAILIAAVVVGARSAAPALAEASPPVTASADFDAERGQEIYELQCAACHRSDGLGYARAIPPHAGNLPVLLHAEGGRDYLVSVVLYGLRGEITALNRTFDGVMPPRYAMPDEDLAEALNYAATAFGNDELLPADFNLYTAEDVAAARGRELSADDVLERRLALDIPDVDPADLLPKQRPLARLLDTPAPRRLWEMPGPPEEAFEVREPAMVDREAFEPPVDPLAIVDDPEEVVEVEVVDEEEPEVVEEPDDFDWQALGEGVYAQCAGCHQPDGSGVVGAFPPLAGHAPEIANVEGGRDYLIKVVLFGLQGPIEVAGQTYDTPMPPFLQLSDEQVAAVVNHVLHAWDNDELLDEETVIVPGEVAELRDLGLTPGDVHDVRQELELPQ